MLQVLTAKQIGTWHLHLYPYIPKVEDALDALAEEMHAPAKHEIASEVFPNSIEVEWAAFDRYVQYVVAHDPFAHVPLQRNMPSGKSPCIPPASRPSHVDLY